MNQAVYIPDLAHNLLSTMQVRLNDVKVNETPRFLTETPNEHTHSLVSPMDDSDLPYVIPLTLKGVASSFPTRKPTREEFDQLPHLVLTGDSPDYDPHDPTFEQQEDALIKHVSETGDRIGAGPPIHRICLVSNTSLMARRVNSELDGVRCTLQSISVTLDEEALPRALESTIEAIRTSAPGKHLDADHLAKCWGIDLHTARRTVKATTQPGIRTLLNPSLSRRFRTNDRQLRYRRLPIDCFTDILISNTARLRGNKFAQMIPLRTDGAAHIR